jgi:hypothetical protein
VADEGTYTFGDDSLTFLGTSKVTVSGVVQFVRDREVICSVDAVVDFATIPPELHAETISCLMRQRTRVFLQIEKPPADPVLVPAPTPPSSAASPGSPVGSPRRSIWSRLRGVFDG